MEAAEQRNRWLLVAGTGLAVFMAAVDMSIVTVALPAIEGDIGTRTSLTQWVVLGYSLPLIALALPGGRWLDRVGKRAALTFSVAGFGAASAAAGLAPGIGWLIGARVLQGTFGAVLFALIPALTTLAVRPSARGRALSVVTTVGPLGMVAGPAVGGLVVETLGWPWIFYLNLPVSVIVVGIGLAQLPADGPLRAPGRTWAAEAAVFGGAAAALLLGLSLAARDGLGWLALALAAVPLLLGWRAMPSSRTVRHLVRGPGMAGPHLALGLETTAIGLVSFLTPFYLHRVLDASPTTTGFTMLAFPVATAAFGPVAGVLADRWDARRTALTGLAVAVAGLLLLAPLGEEWTPVNLAWRLAVLGVGAGLFNAPNMTMAMSNAPRDLLATTGASTSATRQLGFALGPALATVAWATFGYTSGGMRAALALGAGLCLLGILALTGIRLRKPAGSLVAGNDPSDSGARAVSALDE